MTDENKFDAQSRRKFLKTTGAVGAAATTGVAAFGGQAAAQDTNVQADQLFGSGLIVVQGVDVIDDINVEDVTVQIIQDSFNNINIDVDVQNVDVLSDNVVRLENVLSDINVSNVLNENVVQVNVLSGGLIGTDTVRVPSGLL